jgi:hypothetical protein
MMLLGCDEKIVLGKSSDFEYFDLWESILPLAEGHIAVENYKKSLIDIGSSLPSGQYTRGRSIRRWRQLNALIYGDIFDESRTDTEVEGGIRAEGEKSYFIYDLKESVSKRLIDFNDLDALTEAIVQDIELNADRRDSILRLSVSGGGYVRPVPYYADRILESCRGGEAISSEEENLLYFQLLINLLIRFKKAKKQVIELWGDTENALKFTSYIHMRRLFSGEVRVQVQDVNSVRNFTTEAISVYPDIWLRPMISGGLSGDEADRLRSEYPISAIYLLTGA